jgi:hypothetical protein
VAIFFSSAAVRSFSAQEVGHIAPLSRFALSLKPNVAYLALNLSALWKKQRIAFLGVRGHPVPGPRHEVGRGLLDQGMKPLGHVRAAAHCGALGRVAVTAWDEQQ